MKWRVIANAATEADVAEATDWYEAQSAGLGARFLAELDAVIGRIQDKPLQYAVAIADARRVQLRRFPYALVYRVQDSEIRSLGCFHTSRNPRRWRARLRDR